MTHDVIDRLVRPANPVPDPMMLEADGVSTLPVQWREQMQQQQVAVERAEERKGRGPLIGIAAAVAVLVIGGLALIQWTDGPDVAADSTPLEIASAYLEAYSAFDVDTVASLLAEDAEVLPWESFERRDWRPDMRYLEAAGFELIFDECVEQAPVEDTVTVRCAYDAHGLGSDQIGVGPFDGHLFRVVIEDGQVISSSMGFNFSVFAGAMWFPFQAWIQENHPEDFSVLYVDETLTRQTDEAIALWAQRVAEYVEYVNNQS
jgi:hypothetical protein